jgi:hypothetical protein
VGGIGAYQTLFPRRRNGPAGSHST